MGEEIALLIQKALVGIGGEPKSVKRLSSGDLLLETNSALQTKSFLLAKTFLDSPVNIIPHKSLNTSPNFHSRFETNNAFKIPTVPKLSASTEAQLLPTTSSAAAKSSESQPPVPSVITTSSASISLITSTTTMFTALSNKTHPSALETTTSNSIPSTIISPVSHATTLKISQKKRNPKTICNVTGPTVKPKIEIKMAPHKPRKKFIYSRH
ncbi:hypothetical protein TNCV_464641 [Trichonephila clavipes]|nr:hypothetical protein TNCV_464641 [Trichonephila clavipes]